MEQNYVIAINKLLYFRGTGSGYPASYISSLVTGCVSAGILNAGDVIIKFNWGIFLLEKSFFAAVLMTLLVLKGVSGCVSVGVVLKVLASSFLL